MIAKINRATFLKSAKSLDDSPPPIMSEIVFLGRSNVGKSSLINSLTNSKGLAKSSKTPGKTKLLNFFEIEGIYKEEVVKFIFIDLPGFGYAKVSKSLQENWGRDLLNFLQKRDSIKLFIHLIDSRHIGLKNDIEAESLIRKLSEIRGDRGYMKVFTKGDKLTRAEFVKLQREYPDSIIVSSLKKDNIDALRIKIFETIFGKKSVDRDS